MADGTPSATSHSPARDALSLVHIHSTRTMDSTPFDHHVARLSRRERAAFVGALLAARGWDVEVDAAVIRAGQGDERLVVAVAREGLLPGHGLPRGAVDVDVVVGLDPERTERLATARDARGWDARTLYDMARHGLDETATDRLFSAHFEVTGAAVGPPRRPDGAADTEATAAAGEAPPFGLRRPRPFDTADSEEAERGATRGARRVVILLLALALVAGPPLTVLSLTDLPRADSDPTGPASGEEVGANGTRSALASPTPQPTPEPTLVAPGLTASEISDTPALARAHASLLTNRSFTMFITYSERVDGETVGRAEEAVHVENETVYRSRGTQSGNLTSGLVPVIVRDIYADGEGRYLRRADGALRVGGAADPGTGQFAERSRALVVWYLSGVDSTVVEQVPQGDQVYYWVEVTGDSDPRIDDYRAIAVISNQGFVIRIDARYRLSDSGRVATVSLRHANVGSTTAERPEWMPSGNETA